MRTKQVTVNGYDYELRRLLPDVGSMIYMRMLGALLSQRQEGEEQPKELPRHDDPKAAETKETPDSKAKMLCALALMRGGLPFDEVQFIQRQAILCVSRLEDTPNGPRPYQVAVPGAGDSLKWLPTGSSGFPSIEEDPALFNQLVAESLAFSLASFFSEAAPTT